MTMTVSAHDRATAREEGIDRVAGAHRHHASQDLAAPDERPEAREADLERAEQELARPFVIPAPEVPPGAENLITWDASPEEAGHLIPEIETEDEADVAAEMAEEGAGEAEQELRRAARAATR